MDGMTKQFVTVAAEAAVAATLCHETPIEAGVHVSVEPPRYTQQRS